MSLRFDCTMRRFCRRAIPGALLFAVCVVSAQAPAGVVVTHNRAEWDAATGGPDFFEDFSSFVDDEEYRTREVQVQAFTLQQFGNNQLGDFRNLVDVHPFLFNDNNGTPHSSNYVNAAEGGDIPPDSPLRALTPRETEVLEHLLEGKSNKEIATALDLQVVTVKLHMKGILRKLGAANRTHAVKIVLDLRSAA